MIDLKYYTKEGDRYIALNKVSFKIPLGLLVSFLSLALIVNGFLKSDTRIAPFFLLLIGLLILGLNKRNVIMDPRSKTITTFYSGWLNKASLRKNYGYSQIQEVYAKEDFSSRSGASRGMEIGLKVKKHNGRVRSVSIFEGVKERNKVNEMLKETQWLVDQGKEESESEF